MFKYILKRIGYMLVTLFIIATATFFMMHSIPGRKTRVISSGCETLAQ